jgi:hypothetical protein
MDVVALDGLLPCGNSLERLQLPSWCFGHRTGYAKYPHREHAVLDDEIRELAEAMNDNAIDSPVSNWTE